MGKIATITRRTFLVASAALAGGIAFGYYSYKKPVKNPLLDELEENEAAITPYVLINQNGITLITPHADIGQGATSVQAALLAEELEVSLEDINTDPGMPSGEAYYNTAVAAEAFGIAATDQSWFANKVRALGPVVGKLMGVQVTGGSSTVPDSFEKLRVAGAIARETLIAAAARRSNFSANTLITQNGFIHAPDGTSYSYIDLAKDAMNEELPEEVTLKPEAEWKYIGKAMRRLDIVEKSMGQHTFGIDVEFDDMVFATVKTNPRIGGSILDYTSNHAEKMPGVFKIIPIKGGIGVIANNSWHAFQAINQVELKWGEAPYPSDQDELWNKVSASFTEDNLDSQKRNDGDIDTALNSSDVIEAEYKIPYLAHAPLEPMNATVRYKNSILDIWTGTQIPTFVLANIERLFDIPKENINVYGQSSGGSFGRRLEDDYVHQAVELALNYQDVPIKMTWTREEDMSHDFPRTLQMSRARGLAKTGKVECLDLSIAAPSTIASSMERMGQSIPGPDSAIVDGAWDQPFSIPHYRVTGYRVPPLVPISSWRSVGASGNGFLHDCFLDELIHAAGADPMEERIRLCWHEPSRKVLETVAQMSNWGSDPGPDRGRGVAFTLSFGVPVAEVVEITSTPDGIKIDKVYAALDVGKIIDPINLDNQIKGGIIWGLGHAMNCELTYRNGIPEQDNFHMYEGLKFNQCPEIHVKALEINPQIKGAGEPGVPPAAPALANAIFAVTGKRIRELPLNKHIDFA